MSPSGMRPCRRFAAPIAALLAVLLAVLLSALGCSPGPPWPTDLVPVDHPDLSAAEEIIRDDVGARRETLDKLLQRGGGETRELADAFGSLAEVYHAYSLLDAAIAAYRNAGRLDPASFAWPYQLGLAARQDGRFEVAEEAFARALELRPESEATRLHLASLRFDLGRGDTVGELLDGLVDDRSFAAAAHFLLGRVDAAAGNDQGAVEHFEAALERDGEAGGVHQALGLALRRLGNPRAAEHLAAKKAGLPSFSDPLAERLEGLARSSGSALQRGNQALMAGRLEEAEAAFRVAVEAAPSNIAARRNLALALVRGGKVDTAVRELRDALEIAPEDAQLHFDLGNCQVAKGAPEAAAEAFAAAVERAPDLVAARFNLANVLVGLKRWSEAKPQLTAVLDLEPADRRARYLNAMVDHELGRSEEAVAALEKLVDEAPEDNIARQGLVTVLARAGHAARAGGAIDEAARRGVAVEDLLPLLFELAEGEWRGGRRQESLATFQRAVELAENAPEPLRAKLVSDADTRLANALQVAGHRDEAVELFARATELDPKNATAWLSEASLHILARADETAARRLLEALRQVPEHAGLNHTLARLLATSSNSRVRDGRKALVLAQKAYALDGNLEHAMTLGMALAESGDFEKAIAWQRGLLQQATARRQPRPLLEQMSRYLKLYERRQPVRISEPG